MPWRILALRLADGIGDLCAPSLRNQERSVPRWYSLLVSACIDRASVSWSRLLANRGSSRRFPEESSVRRGKVAKQESRKVNEPLAPVLACASRFILDLSNPHFWDCEEPWSFGHRSRTASKTSSQVQHGAAGWSRLAHERAAMPTRLVSRWCWLGFSKAGNRRTDSASGRQFKVGFWKTCGPTSQFEQAADAGQGGACD